MAAPTAPVTRQPVLSDVLVPNLIVIGAMKCGTTAVHRFLAAHPDVVMSEPKELNFFFGGRVASWSTGNWSRGVEWYAAQFAERQTGQRPAVVRGESSPGYTSPAHPQVAERMATVVPAARLVFLVRDPIDRAVSQYHHHRRDGAEQRGMAEALLDPGSQYVSRGRYHERLTPFLRAFPRDQILVIVQEELDAAPRRELARLFSFAGVEPEPWAARMAGEAPRHGDLPPRTGTGGVSRWSATLPARVRGRLRDALADDVDRLRAHLGHPLACWSL